MKKSEDKKKLKELMKKEEWRMRVIAILNCLRATCLDGLSILLKDSDIFEWMMGDSGLDIIFFT